MSSRSLRFRDGSITVGDSRTDRGDHLFLDPAYRQNQSAQADLAGHGEIAAGRAMGNQRRQRDEHRDSGARPILRNGAGRHVDVDVALLERRRLDPQPRRLRLDQTERGLRALLHHVTELPGQDELAAAGNPRRPR